LAQRRKLPQKIFANPALLLLLANNILAQAAHQHSIHHHHLLACSNKLQAPAAVHKLTHQRHVPLPNPHHFPMLNATLSVFLLLLAALLATLAWSWAPDRPVDALKARWAAPPSYFVTLQGMQVHLRDEGPRDDPTPIVLIHGTSASLHTWDGWVAALSPHRRVIRMDLPGFGLTGPAADGDYSMARYTGFMRDLLDLLKLDEVVIGGNSLGGGIAWQTALAHPTRVRQLVLVDATGYPLQPQSIPIGFRLAQMAWLAPVTQKILPRSMIAASVRNVYGQPDKVSPALIDRYYELTLREGNRASLTQRFQYRSSDAALAGQISQLNLPTLIFWGSEDRLIPPDHAQGFHQDIAGSQLKVFEGLGHVPHEEDPEATVQVVKSFLGLPPALIKN
jgi:pimeloyl-ACP methyl ester carboxylesterase